MVVISPGVVLVISVTAPTWGLAACCVAAPRGRLYFKIGSHSYTSGTKSLK